MEIIPDVDVAVGNITDINFNIYGLWLQHVQGKYGTGNELACCRSVTTRAPLLRKFPYLKVFKEMSLF